MFSIPLGPDLAGLFRIIIELLCGGLAKHAGREWTAATFVEIITANLHRRLARFVAFKARFDAGLAPPVPRPARARREKQRLFDFVPRERGWLKKLTEHEGAASFWKLRELLAEPEMAAFIAADPRVGRLLRPLWWMLSPKLALPEVLLLPPRPLRSAAASTPEPTHGRRADRPPTPDVPRAPPRSREVRLPAFLRDLPDPPIPG